MEVIKSVKAIADSIEKAELEEGAHPKQKEFGRFFGQREWSVEKAILLRMERTAIMDRKSFQKCWGYREPESVCSWQSTWEERMDVPSSEVEWRGVKMERNKYIPRKRRLFWELMHLTASFSAAKKRTQMNWRVLSSLQILKCERPENLSVHHYVSSIQQGIYDIETIKISF